MIVKGIVTGVIRNAETGEFKRSFTIENNVTDYQLQQMANFPTLDGSYRFGTNIFISGEVDTIKSSRDSYVYDVFEVGFVESGVTSPTYNYPTSDTGSPQLATPPFIQIQQRFNPPTADRTITIIGITADAPTSTNIATYKRSLAHAWVTLSPYCIQTTTETLDVFYRIQFLYEYDIANGDINPSTTAIGTEKYSAYLAAIRLIQGSYTYFYRAHHVWSGSKLNYRKTRYSHIRDRHDTFGRYDDYPTANPFARTAYTSIIKAKLQMDYDISFEIGKLVGAIAYGQDNSESANTLVHDIRNMIDLPGGDSPIQNAFGHSTLATRPFYDSTQTQSGTGTFALDGSSWTNPDWPKMYRIEMITGGATGTSTYRLKVRNHFGFYQNFYKDQERMMIQMTTEHSTTNYEGFDIGADDVVWLNYTFNNKWGSLAINANEICAIDLTTQTGKRTHVDVQTNFTATKIGVIAINPDNGDLWVPCRETGLYKVVDPENARTVTKIAFPTGTGSPTASLDRCIAVAITPIPGGSPITRRIWAIFSDMVGDRITNTAVGLWYSDNDGSTWIQDTTWDPTVATYWSTYVANGRVNDIYYMIGDPYHMDGRLLIGYSRYTVAANATYDHMYGMWHDGVSGTTDGPHLNYFYRNTQSGDFNRVSLNDPRTLGHQYSVSSNQGKWGGKYLSQSANSSPQYLYYGSTSVTKYASTCPNAYHLGWAVDDVGDDSIIYIRGHTNGAYLGVYKDNNTVYEEQITDTQEDFSGEGGTIRRTLLNLGDGIFFGQKVASSGGYFGIATLSTQLAPLGHAIDDLNVWTDYGWNGSSWEEGHAGNKSTHTTAQELVDGVTIEFADAVTDPGGAGNWIATDYYTFGVVDGVWLDGSTEVHHKTSLYFKPATEGQTEIEAATLPAITKSVDHTVGNTAFTYQNTSSNFNITDNGRSAWYSGSWVLNGFNGYAQSNEFIPAANIGNNPKNDIHAGVYWYFSSENVVNMQFIVGLSSQTRIDDVASYAGIREESPEYAIRIDPPTNGTAGYVDISAVHSGVEQARINNFYYNENGLSGSTYFRIIIKKDGHVRYTYFQGSHGEMVLYDTSLGSPEPAPPITLPHENYYVDYATSGNSSYGGYANLYLYGLTAPDYYLELGTVGNSTGYWNTDFYGIDYEQGFDISIAGVATPVNVGNNDTTATLATGEYSIFPNTGIIRYSSADVGKAVSVTYTELTNE